MAQFAGSHLYLVKRHHQRITRKKYGYKEINLFSQTSLQVSTNVHLAISEDHFTWKFQTSVRQPKKSHINGSVQDLYNILGQR